MQELDVLSPEKLGQKRDDVMIRNSGAMRTIAAALLSVALIWSQGTWGAVPWGVILKGIFVEATKEFIVDTSKGLAKTFVQKLNDWLASDRKAGPDSLTGGEITLRDEETVRHWTVAPNVLSADETRILADFLSGIDGGRKQAINFTSSDQETTQIMFSSPGGVQIKGDSNTVDVRVGPQE